MAMEEPKKKRRQNVACDSCKLRRIKCDLLELLTALPAAEESAPPCPFSGGFRPGETGDPPGQDVPLAQLVLQNPDVSCTNCMGKELKCTTNQIVNPVRPRKGGRRITEAKKRFGGGERGKDTTGEMSQAPAVAESASQGMSATVRMAGTAGTQTDQSVAMPMDWDAFNIFQQATPGQPTQAQPPPFLQQALPDANDIPDFSTFLIYPVPENGSLGWLDPTLLQGATPLLHQPQANIQPMPPQDSSYDRAPFKVPTLFGGGVPTTSLQAPSPQPSAAAVNPQFLDSQAHPPSSTHDGTLFFGTHPGPIIPLPSPTTSTVASIWRALANSPHEAMPHVKRKGITPSETQPSGWTGTGMLTGMLGEFQEDFAQRQREAGPDGTRWARSDVGEGNVPRTEYHNLSGMGVPTNPLYIQQGGLASRAESPWPSSASPLLLSSSTSRKRARQLVPSSSGHSSLGGPGDDDSVAVMRPDPWRLWAPDEHKDRIVHWGRREEAQERLADRALGLELSRHLVKVYLEAVHSSYPAISPDSFYFEWIRAGQRSDRMTPAQEVLCAVMEAWGSHYSDSPIVLGLKPEKAKSAPKVIRADGTFIPGTQARTHWGRARLTVCNALVGRARRLIDSNGVLRKPSITGVQALSLYLQLLHMIDQKVREGELWMEEQMVHSTIMEQMKLLGLMWESDRPIITDDAELPMTVAQLTGKQRRLFWLYVIGDALAAAAEGKMPKMAQEEVDSSGEWLLTIRDRLPVSLFKALSFFLSCYHRISQVGREVAIKITRPGRKKGTLDIPEFCRTVRKLWGDTDSIARDLITYPTEILNACDKGELLGFSPINHLANLSFSGPFILLLIHQTIREQLDFRKTLKSAYIVAANEKGLPEFVGDMSTSLGSTGEGKAGGGRGAGAEKVWDEAHHHVDMLKTLSRESVDLLLKTCRAQIEMIKVIIPTGIIQTASILLRVLVATTQLLAEVPCNEQGYPTNTPGGHGWTWEIKQKEIQVCTEALYQVGWAWPDVADVLDSIMVTMERLTPSPAEIEAWRIRMAEKDTRAQSDTLADMENELVGTEVPTVWGVEREDAMKRFIEEDRRRGNEVLQAAMKYWPPISVPHLIDNSLQSNQNVLSSGVLPDIDTYHSITIEQATTARDAVFARTSTARDSGDDKGPACTASSLALGFGVGGALSGGLPGEIEGERPVMMPDMSSAVDSSGAEVPLQTTSVQSGRLSRTARFANLHIGPLSPGTSSRPSFSSQTLGPVSGDQVTPGRFFSQPTSPSSRARSTSSTMPTYPPDIAHAGCAVHTVDPSSARAMGRVIGDYVDATDGDGGADGGGILGDIGGWYRPSTRAAAEKGKAVSEDIIQTSGHTSSGSTQSPGAQISSESLQNINPETFVMGLFTSQDTQEVRAVGPGSEGDTQRLFHDWAMGLGMNGQGDWTAWGEDGSAGRGGPSTEQPGQPSA